MATRGRLRFQRSSGGARRRTGWEPGPFTTPIAVLADQAVLFSTFQQFTQDGLTVVRLRGELIAFLSAATSALDGFPFVGAGIGIATAQALNVGITAVPLPLTDITWEGWLWHSLFPLIRATDVVTGQLGSTSVRKMIDSKAMRKVGTDMGIFGVFETSGEVGAVTVNVYADSRMLLKLP